MQNNYWIESISLENTQDPWVNCFKVWQFYWNLQNLIYVFTRNQKSTLNSIFWYGKPSLLWTGPVYWARKAYCAGFYDLMNPFRYHSQIKSTMNEIMSAYSSQRELKFSVCIIFFLLFFNRTEEHVLSNVFPNFI